MGIKLKWPSMADQNLDAMEVYRGTTPIDSKSPGSPIATLAGTATEYEDTTVQNKSIYYYRLAARKGSERAWGANTASGYFSETGPGRTTPLRGDWNSGLMDILNVADFITPADLAAKLPALNNYGGRGNFSKWYKMCYKGKVLFVPDTYVVTASWNELYAAGLMFGEAGNGQIPAGVPSPAVAQRTIVNIGGLDYIVRCPKLSNIPYSQYLANQADTTASEWRSTVSRMARATVETQTDALPRFYDNQTTPAVVGPHLASVSTAAYHNPNTPGLLSTNVAFTTRVSTVLVFELVMP